MGIVNTLVSFKQVSKLFFQISAQVYSVPGPTEGRRKAFLEWKSIDLYSINLHVGTFELTSLTCGGNVNCYESDHHPSPTRGNREHLGNFENKWVSSPFSWVYSSLLGQTKGERKAFLKSVIRGTVFWDYSQEHLVVIRDEKLSPFVKFEIILPHLCFLLDHLTNKHCRTWSSMINLWIDSITYQK